MSLPAFADLEALGARLPETLSTGDEPRAQAVLDDASALIRAEAGKTWVTDDELDDDLPDIIVTITLASAKRAFINPSGVTQEATGPFSVSLSNASPDVYLTSKELGLVRNAAGRIGLSSARVEAPRDATGTRLTGNVDDLSTEFPWFSEIP